MCITLLEVCSTWILGLKSCSYHDIPSDRIHFFPFLYPFGAVCIPKNIHAVLSGLSIEFTFFVCFSFFHFFHFSRFSFFSFFFFFYNPWNNILPYSALCYLKCVARGSWGGKVVPIMTFHQTARQGKVIESGNSLLDASEPIDTNQTMP